jgi:hypothetical protein
MKGHNMERTTDVINPEVPETPKEKLALLQLCLEALRKGGEVRGVTPRHISQEGMLMLSRGALNKQTIEL